MYMCCDLCVAWTFQITYLTHCIKICNALQIYCLLILRLSTQINQ